jgi:hypothetical protein
VHIEDIVTTASAADAGIPHQNYATPRAPRRKRPKARAKARARAKSKAAKAQAERPKRKYENKPRPPTPLPTYIKFNQIKEAGIATNYCALRLLIERHGFPPGVWFGSATHVWRLDEVEAWLAARPSEQPKRSPADHDDGDQRRGC